VSDLKLRQPRATGDWRSLTLPVLYQLLKQRCSKAQSSRAFAEKLTEEQSKDLSVL